MASLPGDPQADVFVKLYKYDVTGFINNGYFRMNLLNLILHSTCTYSSDPHDTNYCLGGTVVGTNATAFQRSQETTQSLKLCGQFAI